MSFSELGADGGLSYPIDLPRFRGRLRRHQRDAYQRLRSSAVDVLVLAERVTHGRISRRLVRSILRGEWGVPDRVSVFDDEAPGVANLAPELRGALRRAAVDAAADGIKIFVNSGWRTPECQHELFREAVAKHGSEWEAARWVATPDKSAHVLGDAVDIGPVAATDWLSRYGARYGLCQIYRNEPWHYELRPEAVEHGCPPMYADPTHDPRMRQHAVV